MATDAAYYRLAMRIFADFGGTIAVPAVLAALLGKWLDGQYGTYPRYLIICLVIAFALTAAMIVKKSRFYGKAYKKLIDQDRRPDQ